MNPQAQNIPPQIKLSGSRVRRAKISTMFGKGGYLLGIFLIAIFGVGAVFLLATGFNLGYMALSVSLFVWMWVVWYKVDLSVIPPKPNASGIEDILDHKLLANMSKPISPKNVWAALSGHWQEIFITNRLLLDPNLVANSLSDQEADMAAIWQKAISLHSTGATKELNAGAVACALIQSSPQVMSQLIQQKLRAEDVEQCYDWLARIIRYQENDKPFISSIGRDWAFGFTPMLEQYSTNISQQVTSGKGNFHFMSRSGVVDAVVNNLSQTGSVALVGETGIGKTSVVYALAQRMYEDPNTGNLKDHQVVGLNASVILSSSKDHLEQVMLTLFTEAIRSGNMVIFLDEAQLFFKEGTGSFDLSQILLPVLQNRRIKIIAAFNGTDYQRLKNANTSLITALTPVVIKEPEEATTYKIIEDSALKLEAQTGSIVTYEAIREAYRLSGQYMQEAAYPGKAITALEQSAPYAKNGVITARSVQEALEKSLGVKVTSADGQEASALLNLEDKIHERMINQTEAVKVVAAALRRSRAGVGSSKRPIGSFLFLGPTGVGKTELARSLAATYFGEEQNMIRLDMSEYQQPSDTSRLLDSGAESDSLILNIRKQPFSVILLDEIEKAHSNILNLLLQLLDEGQLTDANGRPANFRNAIIIVTSNAGSKDILSRISSGQGLAGFQRPLIDQLIQQGTFRAELVNRFDEIVLFRPLNESELMQVAQLMMGEVNKTLSNQNIGVQLAPQALEALVKAGYDPVFGARPMRRVIQRTVEDAMATRILSGQVQPGTTVTLGLSDLNIEESSERVPYGTQAPQPNAQASQAGTQSQQQQQPANYTPANPESNQQQYSQPGDPSAQQYQQQSAGYAPENPQQNKTQPNSEPVQENQQPPSNQPPSQQN